MKAMKKTRRCSLVLAILLLWSLCIPVLAASDDNSLSALNIHNGTLDRDFSYDIWEYNVTVEPGTTELLLEPTTSDANATITSIEGTVLDEDGQATVFINVSSESGNPISYILHVAVDEDAVVETESETEVQTETQTEAHTETQAETIVQTEAVASGGSMIQTQMEKLRADSDLMIKILYGLIGLTIVLLFFIIHLILKNHDLKDDLKEAQNKLDHYTNEFARKERMMVTDQYYAPTQQSMGPVQQTAPGMEETFGTRMTPGGYQGMMPEDVPPNRPITQEQMSEPTATTVPEPTPEPVTEPVSEPTPAQAAPVSETVQTSVPEQAPVQQPLAAETEAESKEKPDVDVTMIEL